MVRRLRSPVAAVVRGADATGVTLATLAFASIRS
jgi:hypothetical protein